MSDFKPLLAKDADLDNIDFGNTWVSAKLDGIRAIVIDGVVMSRKLLPIPNANVQKRFRHLEFFDGELIVGEPHAKDVYSKTYSGVMKASGDPEVYFHTFDHIKYPNSDYNTRLDVLKSQLQQTSDVCIVRQHGIDNMAALLDIETYYLDKGFEGVMLRAISGPRSRYKYGRSTTKEGTLLKLKRFSDKEAVIVGVEEEMHNGNEAQTDELGRTKRSSHQENKTGKGRLGALVCKTPEGVTFKIGTGYTAAQRQEMWGQDLVGQLAKYKSFDIGVKDAPRFPVFLGLRSPIDT